MKLSKWQKPDSQLNCPCTPTKICGFHSVPKLTARSITPKKFIEKFLINDNIIPRPWFFGKNIS